MNYIKTTLLAAIIGLMPIVPANAQSDKVLKENDHAMDDIRYFCYTILAREFRWGNWG